MERKQQFVVNTNMRKVSNHYRADHNKVKYNTSNTFLHEIVKASIVLLLKKKKHCTSTECIFEKNYKRADVYDLTDDVVYEVLHSEKEKSIEIKGLDYPVREIIPIDTKDFEDLRLKDVENKVKQYLI